MPINVYTGLMRSGKSYEVVSQVILMAILSGRNVVTNVDGISEELIHAYLLAKHPGSDVSKFGKVRHVVNEDVFKPDFLPYFDDAKDAHTDTTVKPGDMVCIDEAWRFWGTDCKLLKSHKSFFLEHGHFTHPDTGVACDLVLMIQDMGTLNRFLKNVVAFSFRTHKKVSLGLGNTYSVQMWEGHKMTKATQIGNWVRRYDKAVFPLYSSFKGGAEGKTVNADSRQNVFSNRWLWIKVGLAVLVAVVAGVNVWGFFHPVDANKTAKDATAKPAAGVAASPGFSSPSAPPFSSDWRVVGVLAVGGRGQVFMVDQNGRVRAESPSNFQLEGIARIGQLDGQRVSTFSGAAAKVASPSPVGAVAPVPSPSPASGGPSLAFGGSVSVQAPAPTALGGQIK